METAEGIKATAEQLTTQHLRTLVFQMRTGYTSVQPRECCTQIATVARNVVFTGQVNYLRLMDILKNSPPIPKG